MGAMPNTVIMVERVFATSFPEKRVADDGAGRDDADAAPEGEKEPHHDEIVDGGRKGAADGGNNIDGQADKDGPFSSEPVERRSVAQLPQGDPDKVTREGKAHVGDVGIEGPGDRRKTGQVHVYREGAYSGERAENDRIRSMLFHSHPSEPPSPAIGMFLPLFFGLPQVPIVAFDAAPGREKSTSRHPVRARRIPGGRSGETFYGVPVRPPARQERAGQGRLFLIAISLSLRQDIPIGQR